MTDRLRVYHDPIVLTHGTGAFHPEWPRRSGPRSRSGPSPLFDSPDNPMSRSTFEVSVRTAGLLRSFRPDFVLVSAGFDAHHRDPLGGMRVSAEGYARLTRALASAADVFARGRLVSVLEGGYDPSGTAEGALAHARVLAPDREPSH